MEMGEQQPSIEQINFARTPLARNVQTASDRTSEFINSWAELKRRR